MNWMATSCLSLLAPGREVGLMWPRHLSFQEKLENLDYM